MRDKILIFGYALLLGALGYHLFGPFDKLIEIDPTQSYYLTDVDEDGARHFTAIQGDTRIFTSDINPFKIPALSVMYFVSLALFVTGLFIRQRPLKSGINADQHAATNSQSDKS